MNNLITEVRKLIDDESQPYDYDDTTIERYLNKSVKYFDEYSPEMIDGDGHAYKIGYKNIGNFSTKDKDGNPISASLYSLDFINGYIIFTPSNPGYLSITIGFSCHDLDNAVADLWLARAARAKISGNVKLGDEQLPRDKSDREFCIQQSWSFRRNKNINTTRL